MKKSIFKIISLLIFILFVLSGCFKESNKVELEEKIMARKFVVMIEEYNIQKSKREINLSTILDGVYVENGLELEFYDMSYIGKLSEEEINLLASKLYNSSKNFKKAYIVVSNRGLEYQRMLDYVGISDFSDNMKSCNIFDIISLETKVWNVNKNGYKKANGEKIIDKINIVYSNTGDIVPFLGLDIFIFDFKIIDTEITKLTLQGDALVGENFSPSIINVTETEFTKKIYVDLKSDKIKTDGIKFTIWKDEIATEEKVIFFN